MGTLSDQNAMSLGIYVPGSLGTLSDLNSRNLGIFPETMSASMPAVGMGTLSDANVRRRGMDHSSLNVLPTDPTQIAGLTYWYKSTSIVLADGTAISTWPDSSGNGRDQTSAGTNRPLFKVGILNGLPVVRFDGVDDAMSNNSKQNGVSTILVVASIGAVPGNGTTLISTGNGTSSPYGNNITGGIAGGNWGALLNNGSNLTTGEALGIGVFNVLSSVNAGTSCTLYRNGVQKAQNLTRGTAGDSAFATSISNDFALKCDIAEILIYNSALSNANRQAMETYLKNKYAL